MVHTVAVNQRLQGAIDSFVTLISGNRPSAEQIEASKASAGPLLATSTCDFRFELGRQYVIYARKTADGRWTTSACSGTKAFEDAAEDLDYLASIPTAEPTGRVYGSVEKTVVDAANPASPSVVPASGITVALIASILSVQFLSVFRVACGSRFGRRRLRSVSQRRKPKRSGQDGDR